MCPLRCSLSCSCRSSSSFLSMIFTFNILVLVLALESNVYAHVYIHVHISVDHSPLGHTHHTSSEKKQKLHELQAPIRHVASVSVGWLCLSVLSLREPSTFCSSPPPTFGNSEKETFDLCSLYQPLLSTKIDFTAASGVTKCQNNGHGFFFGCACISLGKCNFGTALLSGALWHTQITVTALGVPPRRGGEKGSEMCCGSV